MRIGIVSDCYHPTPNGVTVMVALLKRGLEARGHEVVLVVPRGPRRGHDPRQGPAAEGFPDPDVTRRSVAVLPSIAVRMAPSTSREVARLVRQERLDLVHTHTEGTLGLAARRGALIAGVPLVHTLHTFYRHYLHYLPSAARLPRTAERVLHRGLGRFLRPYGRVIAPSATAVDHLATVAPGTPRTLIPNGVALETSTDDAVRAAAVAAELGLSGPDPTLLCVGRLAPEKRSRELFDALADQLPAGDVRAVLVGGGGLLHELRRDVSRRGLRDRIVLPGSLPHPDVRALYHAASVYVTASRSENHPLTLLEAAAAGLPSVVRADAGLGHLVADGIATAVAGGDDELVARALALATDPRARDHPGTAARRASVRFSAEAHLDLTERLYRDLVGTADGQGQSTTVRSRT